MTLRRTVFSALTLTFFILTKINHAQNNSIFNSRQEAIDYYLEKKGEVYFQFNVDSKKQINDLTRIISIDRVERTVSGFTVYAYANRDEIAQFQNRRIAFTVMPHPGDAENIRTSGNLDTIINWNVYPTYDGYVNLLYYYAAQYPGICKIVDAGQSVQGRHILFARITDYQDSLRPKPKVMLTSSMHGDETAGYVSMLHLIDTLLRSYTNDQPIGQMVSDFEIWINPLANPDGTYWGGNHTVTGARRYNANGKDLNRNFPDPAAGSNPGGTWQPETIVMMQIASAFQFTQSVNFHGGAEVFNFPWDTWARLHPDDDWFIQLGQKYVDTVHQYSHTEYMIDLFGYPNVPGVVNGYDWYRVIGGRQDYMNFFKHCREVTIELSGIKLVPADSICKMWNYNNRSLLQFIQQAGYGLRGCVTDSLTGMPVKASITVIGRDLMDSTYAVSDSLTGWYFRPIHSGSYSLLFRANGYEPLMVQNIRAGNDSVTFLHAVMTPLVTDVYDSDPVPDKLTLHKNFPNPFNPSTTIQFSVAQTVRVKLEIYNALGQKVRTLADGVRTAGRASVIWDGKNDHGEEVSGGIYVCRLSAGRKIQSGKMLLLK